MQALQETLGQIEETVYQKATDGSLNRSPSFGETFRWGDTEKVPGPHRCEACGESREWKRIPFVRRIAFTRGECLCETAAREAKEREERRQMTYQSLVAHSGLTGWLLDARFKTLETLPGMEEAIEAAKAFVHPGPMPCGTLILSGDYGCGKTHIAAAVANHLIRHMVRVNFLNCDQYLKAVRESWGRNGEKPAEPLLTDPLLILDELAPNSEVMHGSLQSELYAIINPRYQAGLPTLVTTNQRDPIALGNVIGGRVLDRLLHRAKWVDIKTGSYRMREFTGNMARKKG